MHWSDLNKDQKAEMVKQVWAENLSAGHIASLVTRLTGGSKVSRKAILGVYHRNKALARSHPLGGRAGNPLLKKNRRQDPIYEDVEPREAIKVFKSAEAALYDDTSLRVPMADLEPGSCRWPVNDAEDSKEHLFCGQPSKSGSSYCDHHDWRSKHRGPLPSYLKD